MTYDPQERRDTPLARELATRIRTEGPISVAEYMRVCLQDPAHGYYRARSAIGSRGDFITAPEISQVFGELTGLWCAVVWHQMGAPKSFSLVELGPGRGTLMADALRAARIVPGFLEAAEVTLVEISDALKAEQRAVLSGVTNSLRWVESVAAVDSTRPAILVGNEFLDALPARQWVLADGGMHERTVALDEAGRLIFSQADTLVTGGPCVPFDRFRGGAGAIVEWREVSSLARGLSALLEGAGAAALFIDYGHVETAPGDTLQAVRGHRHEHPLCSPGEADLTTHVDFEAFAGAFRGRCGIDGPVTQAEFLGALGIVERASRLMSTNPGQAGQIELAVARLMAPQGMGARFKAIGLRSMHLPPLPGLVSVDKTARGT